MEKETSLSEDYLKGWADGKLEIGLLYAKKVLRLNSDFKEGEIYNTINIQAKIKKRFGDKFTGSHNHSYTNFKEGGEIMISKEAIIEKINEYDKITKVDKDFSSDFKAGWHHASILIRSEIKNMFEIKLKQGCGKEVLGAEGYADYTCGDDFPDDDGNPWVAYCPECNVKIATMSSTKTSHSHSTNSEVER